MTVSAYFLGQTKLAVRFWPLICGTLFIMLGKSLATKMYSKRVGELAGVFFSLSPVFIANGFLMTPDTIFALTWALAIYGTWIALEHSTNNSNLWWCVIGVAAGIGLLCKYNMILFFLSLACLIVCTYFINLRVEDDPDFGCMKRWTRKLVWGSLISGIIALVIFSPVIIWNYSNDWVSFKFQLSHGLASSQHSILKKIGNYLGGLLLIVTPMLGIMTILSITGIMPNKTANAGEYKQKVFLLSFTWPMLVFFAYSSLKAWVQPNWPMIAYFSGLIFLASNWNKFSNTLRCVVLLSTIGIDLVVMLYLSLPVPFAITIANKEVVISKMREFHGAKEVAEVVKEAQIATGVKAILTSSHQLFGLLSFYAPTLRSMLMSPADCRNGQRPRFPWIDDTQWKGKDILLVNLGHWVSNDVNGVNNTGLYKQSKVQYMQNAYNEIFIYRGNVSP